MKNKVTFSKHIVSGNYSNGVCIYALIEGQWHSVNANVNTGEIFDRRWKCSEHESRQIQSTIQEHPSFGIKF